ncbi:uncharacterized protein BDCG_16078 [Blastomyces dermatitidis ER-3]|uniref:Uncharacterized protein n=1 Tax=Ajellomyces dermatitidis (strain ER-3 / ATCC MYA-2586) TaxID=559297 RepID=A0ABX2VRZ8_AJEDR|nr:uncharacterized protein BDCG_16078 [Blastomyces dermatitidis ER-3]OAS99357.1 hypothetical protein BDCG_16078 [Blastomyces dermatitidis ER-3]
MPSPTPQLPLFFTSPQYQSAIYLIDYTKPSSYRPPFQRSALKGVYVYSYKKTNQLRAELVSLERTEYIISIYLSIYPHTALRPPPCTVRPAPCTTSFALNG